MAFSKPNNSAENLAGSIMIGDYQLMVNPADGVLIQKQNPPQVKLRETAPLPPEAPRGFINRSAELARLENWISFNEIVLLHAPDGMGKTALLWQAAQSEAAQAMPNGVILLESPGFEGQPLGADDVFQQIFEALFVSDPPLKVDLITARNYLSQTRPLILLDEVPLPPMLQRALPDLIPQGAFLLCADLPSGGDFQRLSIGPLPREAAARLLAERAGIPATETLKFICGVLEDIALAVITVGNLMRESNLTPEETLTVLGAIQTGGMDPIAIALDRAYQMAFNQLGEAERKILSVAAITPGISMAPQWFNVFLKADVEAPIERLKKLGLLYNSGTRLRLPTGFRQVARRRSVVNENAVHARLIPYLLQGLDQGEAFIHAELGNFLGALAWAARANQPEDVIKLGRAIDPYLTVHGLWEAWGGVLDAVLSAAIRIGDRATEAWALHQLGTRLIGLGNVPKAAELLRHALKLRQKAGDNLGAAYTQHNLDFLFPLTQPIERPARLPLPAKILLVLLGLGLTALMIFAVFLSLR